MLIDGDVAFRQHDQGNTDAPNWSTFLEFCGHYFKSPGFKKGWAATDTRSDPRARR